MEEKYNRAGTKYTVDEGGEITAKVCSICDSLKSLNEFHKTSKGFGGRMPRCKVCSSEFRSSYYQRNKESEHLSKAMWRVTNRESESARTAKWLEKNPDYPRIYREENRAEVLERNNRWRRENPEKMRLYKQIRRTRKSSLPYKFSEDDMSEMASYFGDRCALSGEVVVWHLDHVIPLSWGCGGTVVGNILPLRPDLNSSKKDKNVFEWFEVNKVRFGLCEKKFEEAIDYIASKNNMSLSEYKSFYTALHDNFKLNEIAN
ncbi:hypothetical protein [Alteribacter populi]|uniref:hypothetical protein n=1 Tax=Alteribacter populi TaxID=2011011 RepID=UPI000BBB07CC|nr:hypothetical protein [Alteribacter populi]